MLAIRALVCDDGLQRSFLYKGSGWRPSVFRTVGPQGSLFELFLPAGMRVLSGELAEIDVLLDDERLFRPFRSHFDPSEGRPSIPMETNLRLLFLKFRFGFGYVALCAWSGVLGRGEILRQVCSVSLGRLPLRRKPYVVVLKVGRSRVSLKTFCRFALTASRCSTTP